MLLKYFTVGATMLGLAFGSAIAGPTEIARQAPSSTCTGTLKTPKPTPTQYCGGQGALGKPKIVSTQIFTGADGLAECRDSCLTMQTSCKSFSYSKKGGKCVFYGKPLQQQKFSAKKSGILFYNRECFTYTCSTPCVLDPNAPTFKLRASGSNTEYDNTYAVWQKFSNYGIINIGGTADEATTCGLDVASGLLSCFDPNGPTGFGSSYTGSTNNALFMETYDQMQMPGHFDIENITCSVSSQMLSCTNTNRETLFFLDSNRQAETVFMGASVYQGAQQVQLEAVCSSA